MVNVQRKNYEVTIIVSNERFEQIVFFLAKPKETNLSDSTPESLEPLLLQLLLLDPLPNKEAKPSVTAAKQHITWFPLCSKSLRQFVRKIGK